MIDFFRTLPLFSEVPTSALEDLQQRSSLRLYKKDQTLIEQEIAESTVFIIRSGFVKLVRMDQEGRECIHRVVGKGFVLPGTSLFYHDPLPEFVYSITDATVIEIPQIEFEQWLQPFSSALIQLAGEMNRRLYHMYKLSHQLAVAGAQQRVYYFLEQLVTNYGYIEADGVHVLLPIKQVEIAQMLGISRETINRILNELQRKNVLHLQNQSWVVSLDWQSKIS